jgi:membrane protease subunit HflK
MAKPRRESVRKAPLSPITWLLLLGAVGYLFAGLYYVDQNQIAVLTRFERIIDGNVMPGLHYALPWPIDRRIKIPVKQVETLVIDDFAGEYEEQSPPARFEQLTGLKPYCITGDNNIVTITLLIKYTVINPVDYLYGTKSGEEMMNDLVASIIIHNLATLGVDEILTFGKKKIENDVKIQLQRQLDSLNSGIGVSFVEIKEINPPKTVQQDFDDVVNAQVDKRKVINVAQSYANEVISYARSKANLIVAEAESYSNEKVLAAQGDVSRFLSRLEEYKKAPAINRSKYYLDFIQEIYPLLEEIRVINPDRERGPVINLSSQ